MDNVLVRLTIVYPLEIEDLVVETLLEMDPPLEGFTTMVAEGHGTGFEQASARERVRGRTRRGLLVSILSGARVHPVLTALRGVIRGAHVAWWTEPVLEMGRL